ncbi:hypothetical protein DFJ58DRAFT_847138 [Suillus subalutaceus]|uniref:uncharacterized protein n=1 Tax=Suillus subalutaceus TaxID=48586 RepID=UPI001B87D6E6|nr:uncharacterized protein DFJ58DRAFT_847138 [Suillus subalutaceus]KAG1836146.1 hypothetical protein DFJ58DRAFT_847138 [Suillus subalutaceus]
MSKRAASNDDAPITKRIRIDDGNQTALLADKHAWAILEQFLTTDMSYAQMEEALSSNLEMRYFPAMTIIQCTHSKFAQTSQTTLVKNPYLNLDAEEDEDEDEEVEDHDHDGPSDSWKVTSLPGSSLADRFATVINDMTHRFEARQHSSSHGCQAIPSSISDLIPSVGLQDGRMYLLHVQRNITDYITAHLWKKKFAVKVSAWIAGQLYVVADSPKTISKSLPFSLYLAVKQYVCILDEECEVVEHSYNKLPNLAWVKIKCGKYQGDIAQVFDSDLLNGFIAVLVPPRDFPYPMPPRSQSLLDRSRLPNRNTVSDINNGEEVVGFKFKGEMWNQSFLKRTVVALSMQFLHDIECMFQIGSAVRVVAGPYLGVEGYIIQMVDDIFCICQDVSKEQVEVLKHYLDHHPLSHVLQAWLPTQQLFKPPPNIKSIQIGDFIEVLIGEHIGKCGIVHWLPKGGDNLWFQDGTLHIPVPISVVQWMHLPHLQTLQYTQDKGYDVKPGDVVRVTRGPEYQTKGVVQSVDFPNARLTLLSDIDHALVEVPISFVIKVHNVSLDSFKKDIGKEVFIIGGDRKGYQGTLYSFTSENCIVAVHGQQRTKIKPKDVATRYGMRLNGVMLKGIDMVSFCEMRGRSYLAPQPRSVTPPPEKVLPSSSVAIADPSTSSSMWTASPEDQASNPLPSMTAQLNPWTVNSNDILDSIDARLDKLKEVHHASCDVKSLTLVHGRQAT